MKDRNNGARQGTTDRGAACPADATALFKRALHRLIAREMLHGNAAGVVAAAVEDIGRAGDHQAEWGALLCSPVPDLVAAITRPGQPFDDLRNVSPLGRMVPSVKDVALRTRLRAACGRIAARQDRSPADVQYLGHGWGPFADDPWHPALNMVPDEVWEAVVGRSKPRGGSDT